jgi:hypothetical protein
LPGPANAASGPTSRCATSAGTDKQAVEPTSSADPYSSLQESYTHSFGIVRNFGVLAHDRETLERLSVALDWPPDNLRELWEG